MAWNLSQKVRNPGHNKKFNRKPGILKYTKFQYYIETIFSMFYTLVNLEHLWCVPFGSKIVYTIYIYNLENDLFDLVGQNLEITWNFMTLKQTGTLKE